MSSSAMEATGAESEEEEDESNCVLENSNSVSSEPVAKKKGSDTSTSTTNDPSSTSATTTVVVGRPASQPELPTIPTAAAAPPVPRREKKPRRVIFRKQFQTSKTPREETEVARQPTSQSSELPSFAAAAAAAAPLVPLREKKPRRAGFREQFLQKLRVMLDRESQNDSTIVQWSTDGNSFIITDQTQFEAEIIPTYFDNPIVFASFLSKIYRWGFSRLSSRETGHYEFRSPTFRRLGADSAPAAAAVNTCSNAGGGASIQVHQQQPDQASSSLLQQVMAQINQPPPPNPLPSQADAIAELITNIQRQSSSQQPLTPSQHSTLNHQLNMNLHLQPFPQWQHPNPTMNLPNTALSILVGSQTPSAPQRNAVQALMSLYGTSLRTGSFPNTNTSPPAMPQPDHMAVQSLLMLIHRVCEDERQRRAQSEATQNAIIANIGQILGLGSGGGNTTGLSLSVPDTSAFQAHQGIPSLSAGSGSLNFQKNPIPAILQPARSKAGGQLEEVAPQTEIGPVDDDDNDGNDEGKDDHDGRPLSQKKRKSPDDGNVDDDNSPRKKK